MSNGEKTTSTGFVVAIGFIILGLLNLFATGFYRRTALSNTGKLPGFLFISVGVVILIIRAIKRSREQ
jgi:hypothetical protein